MSTRKLDVENHILADFIVIRKIGGMKVRESRHTLLRSALGTEKAQVVAKRAAKIVHFMVDWSEECEMAKATNVAP